MSTQNQPVRWGRVTAGVVYVAAGLLFLLEALGTWEWSADTIAAIVSWSLPLVLVVAGAAIALGGVRTRRREDR